MQTMAKDFVHHHLNASQARGNLKMTSENMLWYNKALVLVWI